MMDDVPYGTDGSPGRLSLQLSILCFVKLLETSSFTNVSVLHPQLATSFNGGAVMVVWWLACSTVDWQVGGKLICHLPENFDFPPSGP